MVYTYYGGMQKKLSNTTKVVVALVIGLAMLTFAASAAFAAPYYAIGEDNPVFSDSGRGSLQNDNNPALRFGQGGRIAIPGQAGEHANENSAVAPYSVDGSGAIVDPQGSF